MSATSCISGGEMIVLGGAGRGQYIVSFSSQLLGSKEATLLNTGIHVILIGMIVMH
jgi:hypothetical protein